MKVLLTDDSASIRMIVRGLLEQLGVKEVLEARDGREALDTMGRYEVDVVFMDIHMPVLDGLECMEKMRNNERFGSIPVIVISSDTDYRQLDRAKALGAFGYIKKPFRIEGVRSAIQAVINESKALKEKKSAQPVAASAPAPAEVAVSAPVPAPAPVASPPAVANHEQKPIRKPGLLSWMRTLFSGG